MTNAAFYHAVRQAIVSYFREIALLPAFPSPGSIWSPVREFTTAEGPVLKVLATNDIRGQVLPPKSTSPVEASAILQRRMAAMALLVRLSASSRFEWSPMMDCGGVRPPGQAMDLKQAFWFQLLCDLNPQAVGDGTQLMERNLVALSRSPTLRFLLCVDSDTSQLNFGDHVEQLLWAEDLDDNDKSMFDSILKMCDLSTGPLLGRTIEIGLSITQGKITHTMIAKLFDVLDRLDSPVLRADGIRCRFTTLRIGTECSVQPKALEMIQARWRPDGSLTSLYLGSIDEIKPSVVQQSLVRFTSEPTSKLRRLGVIAIDSFPAVASVFRTTSVTSIHEIDVGYNPQEDPVWLAYAFFHVDSCSPVTSIILRMPCLFTNERVEEFKRTLQSINPCEELVGEKAHIADASTLIL